NGGQRHPGKPAHRVAHRSARAPSAAEHPGLIHGAGKTSPRECYGFDRLGAGWWAGRMSGTVGFAGREDELSRLLEALGGGAGLVRVVGDGGVGKARFVAEGMAGAAAGGMVLARGECLPLASTLPLLPVAEALGELSRLDGGRLLAAALDAAPEYVRAEVGRLVPGADPGGEGVPRGWGWPRGRGGEVGRGARGG